ncbi:antibiotic biosynthesis monooxygenase [Pontibacter sp. JAM-7]|uniref:antibiotic biosynthesis monooxygenase n=1 Tax=Pontibacter sp. JAM-7 TaxID=3366581 RepID=UPI003AF45CCA
MNQSNATGIEESGATVVITHRVREDKHAEYDAWLQQVAPLCRAAQGHLDAHIIRPVTGVTHTYTVIIRFDSRENLQAWMASDTRTQLIDKVRPLLVTEDDFFISSGLDFWFAPKSAKAKIPIRWKQFLVTWSAIYPMVLTVPLLLIPLLRSLGVPQNHLMDMLLVTGVVVFLMVYLVMPRYTRLIQRWLFK